jgi:hypothetical protein
MVKRGEASWASLLTAEQEEIHEVVAMLTEAAAQGHLGATFDLGALLHNVREDIEARRRRTARRSRRTRITPTRTATSVTC